MKILSVKDLTIEFHDHKLPERAVEKVSFDMDEGEVLGLVGESGSGKSLTAMAIAGLLPRKRLNAFGEIIFEGKDMLKIPRSELRELQGDELSVIFQEPMTALNPTMRIGKQVEEPLFIHHKELSDAERKAKALDWLEKVELHDPERVYHSYPHELSGGMRQRVMIASAMVSDPKLLIVDEPTTALDVTVQAQIIKLLLRLNLKQKVAILFISHDLSLVKQISENVIVMQNGSIIEKGKTKDVFDSPVEEYTKKLVAAIPEVKF